MTVFAKVTGLDDVVTVEGCITFVCIDADGKKMSHSIPSPVPENEDEQRLVDAAKFLKG